MACFEAEQRRRHMERCHDCRHAMRALRALIHNLTLLAWADRQPSSPPTGCVDAALLATYLDKRLTGCERERVEHHLRRCQDCCDELQAAEQCLTTVAAVSQPVPAGVLEKAAALGTPSAPAAPLLWSHSIQRCTMVLLRPPVQAVHPPAAERFS
jgi:hypothetical protein